MKRWNSRLPAGVLAALLCVWLVPTAMAYSDYTIPGQKLVALTFDDAPGPYTDRILDVLKAHGAKATFFVIGSKVSSHQEELRRVVREGHQVGNHTYNHPHLAQISSEQIEKEVNAGAKILSQYTGLSSRFYLRPPYASYNTHVAAAGNVPIVWGSYDTQDWRIQNASRLVSNVMKNVTDGGIIIMHDTVKSTADGLDRLLTELEAKGYTIVTVEDLFWRRGITPRSGQIYYSAPSGKSGVNRCAREYWYDESKLSSHWAYASIRWALDNGYMNRNEGGEFTPEFPLTREMFVTILGRLSGVSAAAVPSGFRDIPAGHFAAPYAAWAKQTGIMVGIGGDRFGAEDPLTRQEMAVVLARYLQYRMPDQAFDPALAPVYTDEDAIAAWARDGVDICSTLGILNGEEHGCFHPENITTRAMGAVILQRLSGYDFPQS